MKTGKILIVEGDIMLSEMLETQLGKDGYIVSSRQTGEKAIEELKKGPVDLLIISTNLRGEMDGFSLVKAIRKDPGLASTPIVVDSSKPGIKEVMRKMGVVCFIEKPFDIGDLRKSICGALKKNDHTNMDVM